MAESMIKKVVMVCVVLMLVTVLAGVAGCIQITLPSNPSTTQSTTTPKQTSPLQSTPTPTLNPSQPLLPTQAAVSGPTSVVQGQPATFTTTIYSVNVRKNVCGAVNYYIDDYAAGGNWVISPAGTCSALLEAWCSQLLILRSSRLAHTHLKSTG